MNASLTRGTLAFRTGAGNFGNTQKNTVAEHIALRQAASAVRKRTGAVSTFGKRFGTFLSE